MKKLIVSVMICILICTGAFAVDEDALLDETKDGIYTNTVLGAQADFSRTWKVLNRQEIAAVSGAMSEVSPSAKEVLEKHQPVFMAMLGGGVMSINITIDPINLQSKALIAQSRDLFVDLFIENSKIRSNKYYADMGVTVEKDEKVNIRFLDEDCPATFTVVSNQNGTMYQKSTICITDDYIFNVTATSVFKDNTDDMLALFKR